MTLPRNAQIWLPGLIRQRATRPPLDPDKPVCVRVAIADHFEPLRGKVDLQKGLERAGWWKDKWPEIARRHPDSAGRPACYTFFYPEDEYRPELIDPLGEIVRAGLGDVEVHLHHDGEGQQNFVDRIGRFTESLYHWHGLLRKDEDGRIAFAFIHGNWALDNSRPDGRWCGLNNEITLLRNLGCYADLTMPSAPHATQARLVNTIYWAVDDPVRPKSYDSGLPFSPYGPAGDLLMIPGPLGLNWAERSRGWLPRIEVGELAAHNPATPHRAGLWLDCAPRAGNNVFVKLFAHGALDVNAQALLGGGLDRALEYLAEAAKSRSWELRWSTPAEMAAVLGVRNWELSTISSFA